MTTAPVCLVLGAAPTGIEMLREMCAPPGGAVCSRYTYVCAAIATPPGLCDAEMMAMPDYTPHRSHPQQERGGIRYAPVS